MLDPVQQRRRQVLQFIIDFQDRKGYPPSVREISEALDASTSSVTRHLRGLHAQSFIELTPKVARGIRVLPSRGLEKFLEHE